MRCFLVLVIIFLLLGCSREPLHMQAPYGVSQYEANGDHFDCMSQSRVIFGGSPAPSYVPAERHAGTGSFGSGLSQGFGAGMTATAQANSAPRVEYDEQYYIGCMGARGYRMP